MKRKFTVFITLLLALVLCFALVACDTNPDNSGKPKPKGPKKEEVINKALTSLDEYFDADVYGGVFDYDVHTKNSTGIKNTVEFVKKDNTVFYKSGDNINMFDTDTNKNYAYGENGWVYDDTLLPQGTFEYVTAVLGGLSVGSNKNMYIEDSAAVGGNNAFPYDDFEYNAKKNTLTAEIKLAEDVNRPLRPLQEVYDENGSLKGLIDAYLEEYKDDLTARIPALKAFGKFINVDNIAAAITNALVLAKDGNMISTFESFVGNDIGAKYEEFLKQSGVKGEELKAAMARTIGQAIEGALKYIEAKIDIQAISGGDYSSVLDIVLPLVNGSDAERAAVLEEMLEYVIFADIDMTAYNKDVENFIGTIVDILGAVKIKPIIDNLASENGLGMSSAVDMVMSVAGPVIKEIIAKPVTLEKLDGTLTVELKADYSVEKIKVDLIAAHDYAEETKLPVLSDNNYSASFTLTLGGVSSELDFDDLQFAAFDIDENNGVNLDFGGAAILNLDVAGEKYSYYLETRMIDGEYSVGDITVVVANGDGEFTAVETEELVSFDDKTSSFVFDCGAVDDAVADMIEQGAKSTTIMVKATVVFENDATYDVFVKLYVVADASTDSAAELVTNVVKDIFGSSARPPENDVPMESAA